MAKKKLNMSSCDGLRKDGTCGNGYSNNHNKKCRGVTCPERFLYEGGVEAVVSVSNYKTRVSDQYQTVCAKTGEFFREVIKFGALLNEVSDFLGESRGVGHDGDGLKGWLEKNCPEVNYNTAKGYKAMAEKAAKMIGGGTQAVAALQGQTLIHEPGTGDTIDVDGDILAQRDALFNEVDSRRKLEQMWFKFCGQAAKPKGGRPKAAEGQVAKLSRKDEAKAIWNQFMLGATKASLKDAIPLLGESETRACYDSLAALVGALKKHLAEFK